MLRSFARSLLRQILRCIFPGQSTLPVLRGPLSGKRIPRQRGLTQLSMLTGLYEPAFTHCFTSQIDKASVVLDIGANFGYFSLMAATLGASRVVAFEPVPSLQEEINQLIHANHMSHSIMCVPLAVSDASGQMRMLTPGSDETGVLESALQGQPVNNETAITVETTTLDEWLAKHPDITPTLVKIDVEGAEAAVLFGAEQLLQGQTPPVIIIEVHGSGPAMDVWAFVEKRSYSLQVVDGAALQTVADRQSWEALFKASRWQIRHIMLLPHGPQRTAEVANATEAKIIQP